MMNAATRTSALRGDNEQEARRGSGLPILANDGDPLARTLGWFSIGLGLAQVAAPMRVAQLIGAPENEATREVLRAVGLREIASGVGLLAQREQEGWAVARVGGDVMDLALLGAAMMAPEARRDRLATATAAVAGVMALDIWCRERLRRNGGGERREIVGGETARGAATHVTRVITIDRPAEELYRFWRNFENLPRCMRHLESVEVLDERRSRWRAKAPAGGTVEWEAEVTEDRPNERLAWRSLPGAQVTNAGTVSFAPATGGRGTVVKVEMQYDPPAGVFGALVAKIFGEEPGQQVQEDLRAFKQVMETGEVVLSEGTLRTLHPGRPPRSAPGERR